MDHKVSNLAVCLSLCVIAQDGQWPLWVNDPAWEVPEGISMEIVLFQTPITEHSKTSNSKVISNIHAAALTTHAPFNSAPQTLHAMPQGEK